MRGFLRKTLLLLAVALLPAALARADTASIEYRASANRTMHRWVIQDQDGSGYLLLVIDEPSEASASEIAQTVVARQRFSNAEAMRAAAKPFLSPVAVPHLAELSPLPPDVSHKPLWEVAQPAWTDADEKDYSDWVKNEVGSDFLAKAGLNVDCADFALTVRWVYARNHGLPAANTLGGTGKLFGPWSGKSAWDALPTDPDWAKDRRFLAAIKFLLNNTYTHTILSDLYPVALSPDYVAPGSILLVLYSAQTGHTQVVKSVGPNDSGSGAPNGIDVLYGDEPASTTVFLRPAWIVVTKPQEGGFLRWRWPELTDAAKQSWALTDAAKMPGYSLEQYDVAAQPDFLAELLRRLGYPLSPIEAARFYENLFYTRWNDRAQAVIDGFYFCRRSGCAKGSSAYDDYSTFARDDQLREIAAQYQQAYSALGPADRAQLDQLVSSESTLWLPLQPYLMDLDGTLKNLSSDPNDPPAVRWAKKAIDFAGTFKTNAYAWAIKLADEAGTASAPEKLVLELSQERGRFDELASTLTPDELAEIHQLLGIVEVPVADQKNPCYAQGNCTADDFMFKPLPLPYSETTN